MSDRIPESISEATAPGATMTAEQKAEYFRQRREVPLLALPGAFFTFGLTALCKLEDALNDADPGFRDRREGTVFAHLEKQLLGGNPKMVTAALDVGLKRKDDQGRNVPFTGIDLEDLPCTVGEIVEAALPALCVAMTGKTYAELLEDETATIQAYVNGLYQPPKDGERKEDAA